VRHARCGNQVDVTTIRNEFVDLRPDAERVDGLGELGFEDHPRGGTQTAGDLMAK